MGYKPISDRVLVVRLKAKPRNITLIQVYGPTTAATDEEMERFYQDLSQAVKQVPNQQALKQSLKHYNAINTLQIHNKLL